MALHHLRQVGVGRAESEPQGRRLSPASASPLLPITQVAPKQQKEASGAEQGSGLSSPTLSRPRRVPVESEAPMEGVEWVQWTLAGLAVEYLSNLGAIGSSGLLGPQGRPELVHMSGEGNYTHLAYTRAWEETACCCVHR